MNIKKIVMSGVLLLGIGTGVANSGNIEPNWVSVHRVHKVKGYNYDEYGYVGAKTDNTGGKCARVGTPYILHGIFMGTIFNLTDGRHPFKKIVIKQKKPCFVVPQHFDEYKSITTGGKWVKREHTKVERKGNVITMYVGDSSCSGSIGVTELGYKARVKLRKNATQSTARLIAGDSFDCLNEPSHETWTVYWWLKNPMTSKYEWVAVSKENITF